MKLFVMRLAGVGLLVLGYRIAFGEGLPPTMGVGELALPLGVFLIAVGGALLYSSFQESSRNDNP